MADLDRFLAITNGQHDLRVYDDALNFMAGVRDQQKLQGLIGKVFPRGADSPAFAHLLKEPLHATSAKARCLRRAPGAV